MFQLLIFVGMAIFVVGIIQMAAKKMRGPDRLLLVLGAIGILAGTLILATDLLTGDAAAILCVVLVVVGVALLLTAVFRHTRRTKA